MGETSKPPQGGMAVSAGASSNLTKPADVRAPWPPRAGLFWADPRPQALPSLSGPKSRVIRLRQTVARPVMAAFIAGGIAGAVSRTVVSPLERLKILFQVQSVGRQEYKLSVGKGLAKMWTEEGWRGLMRGNGTNCIRIVPYSAVQFGSYNFYKKVCESILPWPSCYLQVSPSVLLSPMEFQSQQLTCGWWLSSLRLLPGR